MAITRAQQYRQMLEEGGRIGYKRGGRRGDTGQASYSVSDSFTGPASTKASAPPSMGFGNPPDDRPQDNRIAAATNIANMQKAYGVKSKGLTKKQKERREEAKANRGLATLNLLRGTGLPKADTPSFIANRALDLLLPFRNFTLRKNIDYFKQRPKAIDRYGLSADGYKKYIEDRLAGKIDAAGNIAPGFMEGPGGVIMSTGNDGREDPIIPVVAEAMKEDTKDDLSNIFSRFGINPRIAGSIFGDEDEDEDDTEFAADGGRIGYDDGGMLVQPGFGGTRQGYRSAKAQESKEQSAKEYKASTTQQQRDDDRRDFQEQRKKARQQLKETKPTFDARKFLSDVKDKTQGFRDAKFIYDLATQNYPAAFQNLAVQFAPISQTGIATPNIATGNIVYDERLGFIDATTGEPVNTAMPGATQAKTYSTQDIKDLLNITDKKSAEKFVKDPIIGGAEFITREKRNQPRTKAEAMDLFRENLLEQEIDYPEKTFDQQRSGAMEKGISPTDRSLIPSDFLIKPGEAAAQKPFVDIAKDIDREYDLAEGGMIYDNLPVLAAEGGIMDLGRQELFLGGIAKGLKKAARGVSRTLRKVAKSPIGKAAILGAIGFGIPGTSFGGIFGKGALSKLIGQKAMTQAPFAPGTGILGFIQKNPLLAIGGISALSGLLTKKQEDDDLDLAALYASGQLTPSQSVRGTGSEFDFYKPQFVADGGRIGYQEGSKEPVAKKTMPLLDMDGQEMDLRDNGGFVPIGRMEKADDVPARLSKNEFVFTADAVRNAGDGDVDKGAEVMYNMMKNLERGGNVSDESQGLEGAREMFQTSKRLEEVL